MTSPTSPTAPFRPTSPPASASTRRPLEAALASGAYLDGVLADQRLAVDLNLRDVPAIVAGRDNSSERLHLSGARPYAALDGLIRQLS